MPGYDLHPGVDAEFNFPPEVRAAIVASPELVAELNTWYTSARARGNHTGTQLAATISDFATAVRALTASETANGTSERATAAEVQAMTDTTRYISPAGLAAAAVAAGTANRIVRRDASGRAQVAAPAVALDIANKAYVDSFEAYRGANRPIAQLGHTGNWGKSGAASAVLMEWATVLLSRGNLWDPVTNRMVAPVKGLYEFHVSANQVTVVGGPQVEWWRNGATYKVAMILYMQSYLTGGSTLLVELNAGDYIEVRLANNNGTTVTVDGTRALFSGQLIDVLP